MKLPPPSICITPLAVAGPFLRWSIATTWAVLLPSLGAVASCVLAARLPLGAFLAGLAFLVALACVGARLALASGPASVSESLSTVRVLQAGCR